MTNWRLLPFFLFFFSSLTQAQVQGPEACLTKKIFPCAVRASQMTRLSLGGGQVTLGEKSSLLLQSESEARLLEGALWGESLHNWTLLSAGRKFLIEGDAWILKEGVKTRIRQFLGASKIQGPFPDETLPQGFENSWSFSEQGLMQPLKPAECLVAWNKWLKPSGKNAKEQIQTYQKAWADRIELSSNFYQEIVQTRRLAKESEIEREIQRREAYERESAKLRKMFRSRHLVPMSGAEGI